MAIATPAVLTGAGLMIVKVLWKRHLNHDGIHIFNTIAKLAKRLARKPVFFIARDTYFAAAVM